MRNHLFKLSIGNLLKQYKSLSGFRASPTITTLAAGLMLVAPATLPVRAQDAPWGCQVLLCAAATTPSWSGIPYCVPPMTALFQQLARGGGWPSCPEGGETSGLGYQPFKPCAAPDVNINYQPEVDGSQGMIISAGVFQADPNGAYCGNPDLASYSTGFDNGMGTFTSQPIAQQLTHAVANPEPYYVDITPTGAAPTRFYFSLQGY